MRTIVFYSFKGGVGRTALCANLGVHLAKKGRRVLLIDWDLRAPGLTDYLRPKRGSLRKHGVVDFLNAAAEIKAEVLSRYDPIEGLGSWDKAREQFDSLEVRPSTLVSEPIKSQDSSASRGEKSLEEQLASAPEVDLKLIHAGSSGGLARYVELHVNDPRWRACLARYFSEDLHCRCLRQIEHDGQRVDVPEFDLVFVDAQAGGAATSLLPRLNLFDSHLFLVGGLNQQNREGLLRMLREMTTPIEPVHTDDPFGGRVIPLDHLATFVSVVVSPMPDPSDDRPRRRLRKFEELIDERVLNPRVTEKPEVPPNIWTLPYCRALALKERLLTLEETDSEYAQRVAKIAEHPVFSEEGFFWPYNTLTPPPTHPVANLPDWTWLLRDEDRDEAIRRLLSWPEFPEDQVTADRLRTLLNVLWWDSGLSDSGFKKLIAKLDTASGRRDIFQDDWQDWSSSIVGDRRGILKQPRDGWANQTGDVLNAIVRFGSWVYERLERGSFLQTFVEMMDEDSSQLPVPSWTEFAPFWFYLAEKAKNVQQMEPAIRFMERAVKLNPGHAKSRLSLVTYLAEAGEIGRASEELSRTLEWCDQLPQSGDELLNTLGQVCAGYFLDIPTGLSYFRRLLEKAESSEVVLPEVLRNQPAAVLGYVQADELLDELVSLYLRYASTHPTVLPPFDLSAVMTLRLGREEEAEVLARRYIRSPDPQVKDMGYKLAALLESRTGQPLSEAITSNLNTDDFTELPIFWSLGASGALPLPIDVLHGYVNQQIVGRSRFRRLRSAIISLQFLCYLREGLERHWGEDTVGKLELDFRRGIVEGLDEITSQTGNPLNPGLRTLVEKSRRFVAEAQADSSVSQKNSSETRKSPSRGPGATSGSRSKSGDRSDHGGRD